MSVSILSPTCHIRAYYSPLHDTCIPSCSPQIMIKRTPSSKTCANNCMQEHPTLSIKKRLGTVLGRMQNKTILFCATRVLYACHSSIAVRCHEAGPWEKFVPTTHTPMLYLSILNLWCRLCEWKCGMFLSVVLYCRIATTEYAFNGRGSFTQQCSKEVTVHSEIKILFHAITLGQQYLHKHHCNLSL